ncbi:hypothetical protein Agabi119p4_1000 [Agaricus bisporus var. burnettii]|uniref:Protein BCP1 n=1 Tax=Agaricus bisporus var. burnettii TaxID=192524 RepID=A0A8H7FBZ7_AGABI
MKRKQTENDVDSDGGSDISFINVDFDFFGPNPAVDFLAINRLLQQLFQWDAEIFDTNKLTDLILAQPGVGSTVKTDGEDSDPFALLTALNMHIHHEHPSIKSIANYCLDKVSSSGDRDFHDVLHTLFSQNQQHVGLVICERLINMPVQVIPPMYRMLTEELRRAISNSEPYQFSHFLFISRCYHLTPEEESALANSAPRYRPKSKTSLSKKSRQIPSKSEPEPPADGIYSFHPEDVTIREFALHTVDFKYNNAPKEPREKDAFGLDVRARIMLIPAERFQALVDKLQEVYNVT